MTISNTTVVHLDDVIRPDRMATQICNQYTEWNMFRTAWLQKCREVRDAVFATNTNLGPSGETSWRNRVHIPKLCQIRDNLHANYMAALFPNDRPIVWEGADQSDSTRQKSQTIEMYMQNKMSTSKYRAEVSKLLYDFIDYGNCFAMPEYVSEVVEDPIDGTIHQGYVGPRLVRISPTDIVFNPTATSFSKTAKIIRSVRSLGTLKKDIITQPDLGYLEQVFDDKIVKARQFFSATPESDIEKNHRYTIDGFSSYYHYMNSESVELLHFYGDYYDVQEGKLYENRLITIADRAYVLRNIPNPSWTGRDSIRHVGWRQNPDNLYGMGPLENLLGMQHRINHLENGKADALDLILFPVQKVRGYVEDYDYGPNERIYVGDDGDVEFMRPDTTVLNADTQMALYEAKMEEMAGSPKQAMGFRTPGEKTAYEVQILEQGANKIFLNKATHFEEVFLEPLINDMLEMSRRNMDNREVIRVINDEFGVNIFKTIKKEDLSGTGAIRAVGARHFARNANLLQTLTQFANSALSQDPTIKTHFSGYKTAKLIEELMGIEQYDLVTKNISISEQTETAELHMAAEARLTNNQVANEVAEEEATADMARGKQGGAPVV